MLNRSIERDFDINYHSRAFRKGLAELKDDIRILREVDYDPHELIMEMGQVWTELMLEFEAG